MNKVKVIAERAIETYKLNKRYSRLDGPCIIDSGITNKDSLFYCEPTEIWGFMGEIIPYCCPKISDKEKTGDWRNANLLKTALHFDREYAAFLIKRKKL